MADLTGVNLDPNVAVSTGGKTLILPGTYKAIIVKDRIKDNKSGTGKVWNIKVQIVEGQYANELLNDYINITHKSAECQAIGQGTLRQICELTKQPYPPTNTDGMIGIPFGLKIGPDTFKGKDGKDVPWYRIKGYTTLDKVTRAAPVQAQAQAPATAATTKANEAW